MNTKKVSILLDDSLSSISKPSSRIYDNPLKKMVANSFDEIDGVIDDIELCLKNGFYVVTLFSYELGNFFNGLSIRNTQKPLIVAWSFKNFKKVSKCSVDKWLVAERNKEAEDYGESNQGSGVCNVRLNSCESKYKNIISYIHKNIRSGNTYQVNYTFRIFADSYGSKVDLYMKLRDRQPSRFGALIREKNNNVMSFSPEWFVELNKDKLRVKPMKGTLAIAGSNPSDLIQDKKNRAENLMIVDLLRNDLGRVSEVGSVKVPKLFEVERVGEIFQMTSTVESKIKKNIGLKKLLESMYPCGSVTGAPKHKTMQIIQNLEDDEREFYCGSLGWLDPCLPSQERLGNFMMSVSIRTAVISGHNLTFGVGSGVTIDSNYMEEWRECLLKASFLIRLPSGVGLFETLRIEENCPRFFKNHVDRMIKSADSFGIPCDRDQLEQLVQKKITEKCQDFKEIYKLKINLSSTGFLSISIHPLTDIELKPKIYWAADLVGKKKATVNSKDPTFYHKTTNRTIYDSVWKLAERRGGFDGIFLNENGEVTEGGRSNLLIKKGGIWQTPPVSSGLLPGIMRAILISDKRMNVQQVKLTPKDIVGAENVYVTNSLRGILRVDTSDMISGIKTLEYSTIDEA